MNKINFKIISKSVLTKNFTFIDYLKSGVEIGLSVAIDFTNSNGNPSDPSSLHYIYGGEPNQYERAICSCGNILSYYDYNQFYPCFGFGAKIEGQAQRLPQKLSSKKTIKDLLQFFSKKSKYSIYKWNYSSISCLF